MEMGIERMIRAVPAGKGAAFATPAAT